MTPGKEALLISARSGMELSWRYAWVGFLMLSIYHQPFPLPETAGAFAMAIILNHLSADRNWRLYQGLLLESAGLALVTLLTVYRMWYPAVSFFSFTWMGIFFREPWRLSQKFMLVLILFCLLVIWRGGRALVKKPADYDDMCIQFDKGIGFFMLLFLIKFLLQEKAGILVDGLAHGSLLGAFFIFSLLSIYLARKQPEVEKSFLPGYQGVGITLSLVTGLVLFGSGATFFFYPILTQVADTSLVLVRGITEPLVPTLVAILLFIFSPGRTRLRDHTESGSPVLPDAPANTPAADWMASLLHTISIGFLVMVGIIALVLLGLLILHLIRLLMIKNADSRIPGLSLTWLVHGIKRILLLPWQTWSRLVSLLKDAESAANVYSGLLRWGHRNGLGLLSGETPLEYGRRLARHFPVLEEDIELIVQAFNREIYGQMILDPVSLLRLLSAQGRLRHPRHWPARIRVCFFR